MSTDLNSITIYLNTLRERYEDRSLLSEELQKALPPVLKKRIYALEMNGIVYARKEGKRKIYTFPKEPIHISKVEALLKKVPKVHKEHKLNEQECINFLKSLGYKILQQKFVEI